jgi:hypothetical protein
MTELLVFFFCAAIGFAIAGTAASFYQLVTAKPADFLVAHSGVTGNLVVVLLTMFGGPFIVTRKILDGMRAGQLTPLPAALGLLVVGLWSVCAGLFFLGLLVTA